MYNEILEAGRYAAKELQPLTTKEYGPKEEKSSVTVTILKILTVIAGIFFSMIAAISLPPDLAFVAITLIAVTVTALVTGAEKIVAIFPRFLWIPRNHPSRNRTVVHYEPSPQPSWSFWQPSSWSIKRPSGGHSVYSTTDSHQDRYTGPSSSPSSGGHSVSSSSSPYSPPQARNPNATTTGGHTAKSGGHHGSPYAGGTPGNVASGSQQHDRRNTAPQGNVLSGSRQKR